MIPAPETAMPLSALPITDREFTLLRDWIHRSSGIFLAESKRALLVRRVSARLRALEVPTFGAYYKELCRRGPEETIALLDAIATHETSFFREPRQFELLEREICPAWRREADAGRRPRRVRAWSAACSTGEEPYSLAMALLEAFPPESGWRLEILATDLSTRALERAREGVWTAEKAGAIPPELLKRYFLRGKNGALGKVKAGPELRQAITFERFNLAAEAYPPLAAFDLVLCRNVLIYFDPPTRARVVSLLLDHLAPDGLLFVGHAENLAGLGHRARPVMPTVYRPLAVGEAR
jgi:chemotaxis protein methyltransferase CheR